MFVQIPLLFADVAQLTSIANFEPKSTYYPKILEKSVNKIAEASKVSSTTKRTKKYKKIITELDELAQKSNRGFLDEIFQLKAYLYEKLGDDSSALLSYEASLNHKTDNPVSLFRHAMLLRKKSQCVKAIFEFKEVLWRYRQFGHEAHFNIALCSDEKAVVSEHLHLALSIKPGYTPAIRSLLELAKDDKSYLRTQNELSLLQQVISKEKHTTAEKIRYAEIVQKTKDPLSHVDMYRNAENYLKQAVIAEDYNNSESVNALFKLYIRKRQVDVARELIANAKAKGTTGLDDAVAQLEIEASL